MPGSPQERELLSQAAAGDQAAFAVLVEPHQRDMFRHCYRMLGSGADAEDATQDTLVRAWRGLPGFDGSGAFGGWLHRIATNVCLDLLRGQQRRLDPVAEGPPAGPGAALVSGGPGRRFVEPVSDLDLAVAAGPAAPAGPGLGPLGTAPAGTGDPQQEVVRREEISLAFVAALQRLAPRQRAALLLHDVLGFAHAEVAQVLGISPGAVNSLLSRARQTVRSKPWAPPADPASAEIRELLGRYLRAWQLADITGFVQVVTDDVRLSMPPLLTWFDGRDAVAAFVEAEIFAAARPHGVPMRAGWCNGQPAFATYQPGSHGVLAASGLQVLELTTRDGPPRISAIVSFRDPALAARCGLPARLG
jgi:RNA polymerase sigma-70 factor (TIGR02960 family)